MHLVLNIPGFKIYQGSEYLRVQEYVKVYILQEHVAIL